MNVGKLAASDTLLRLVRFAAAACESRYVFVVAAAHPQQAGAPCAQFWAARDYGLRTECRPIDFDAGQPVPSTPADFAAGLRRMWPDEAELQGAAAAGGWVAVPLLDSDGHLLGHLGAACAGTASLYVRDRLPALGPVAAQQLAIWSSVP